MYIYVKKYQKILKNIADLVFFIKTNDDKTLQFKMFKILFRYIRCIYIYIFIYQKYNYEI